jgi:hypothetical protein
MIGFEVFLNGQRLCIAGAGDAVLTAIVSSVPKRQELKLEVGGLAEEAHLEWHIPRSLVVGDEVIVRVLETQHPDSPAAIRRDDRALVEESERQYYQRLKQKYEGP